MWNKKGIIFSGDTKFQTPIAFDMNLSNDSLLRVYYAARNAKNKSEIKYFEISLENPQKILFSSPASIIPIGDLGTFDQAGVMPSSAIRPFHNKDEVWLYYTGWSQRLDIPYHNSIGLAISLDGGKTFKKHSKGPIITSSILEPYFVGTPHVIHESGLFRCWYYSSTGWFFDGKNIESKYHIKYAESKDGIIWDRRGLVCLDYKSEEEIAICTPTIIVEDGVYKMWFSYRGLRSQAMNKTASYKIGYAESDNGLLWTRKDADAGIGLGDRGWDSEMICYPNVIKYGESKYMLYNGNNFGETGIGIAEWECLN
tara:strand:- start:38396 stop:39331 length:936 start_codon:yes stop_codon:yes gene_type:complete